MGADVIAAPPAVVAAAYLEAHVFDGALPLRERRRVADGRRRRRPSCGVVAAADLRFTYSTALIP